MKITKDIVKAVKNYKAKYPHMTNKETAKLVGVSDWAVSCIINGNYNHLLEDTNEEADDKSLKSQIPYEAYKRLVACELAIDEMLDRATAFTGGDKEIFFDFRYFANIIKRYFPEEYEKKLTEVYKGNY